MFISRSPLAFFRRATPFALSTLSLALLGAHAAQAQTTPQQQLERVTISGSAAALDRPAGSSSRLGLSLRETPASVTVVDSATIEARGASNTQEILKNVPGVVFADPPGSAGSVFYRGFGSGSLAQLYNGISVQYDAIAARPVDSWIVERVEAIGGPSSFLNGSGAMGGTLNVITKIADGSGDISRARVALGDRAQLAASLQRSLGETGQVLRVELNRSEGALWTQGRDRSAWQLAASWRAPLSSGLTHTLALERQHEKVSQPYWGTPMLRAADGSVSGALHFDPATYGVNYNVQDGRYEQDVSWLRSLLEWQIAPSTRLQHTLYHYDALRDYENVEAYTFKNGNRQVERSSALLQRHDQQVWGSRGELSHATRLAGLRSDFAFGWDWSFNRQTRFPLSIGGPFTGSFGLVDPYAPVAGSFLEVPGMSRTYTPSATNRLRSFALFAENRTELGAGWSVVSALRADRLALEVRNHRDASPPPFQTRFKPLTGRLGLVKDLSKDWQVYAQASTAADPPSGVLATAGFSALRDFDLTKGRQFELGSKLSFDEGRGSATLAVYEIRRKNLSITDPNDTTKVIPVGEQSSRGLELAARWRPAAAWQLGGHWSYTRARYENFVETVGSGASAVTVSRAGNTPANVPRVVAGLSADWQANESLRLGADWRHVGKRYANTANTLWDEAYQLLGLSATLRITPQLTARARIDNVADTRYVANLSSSLPYLGAPRSVSGALDWQF